ncbi:hypothetical protein RvY_05031 [Ramazzottius varieornatus]|uniref:Protein kinase domain-containing protein n=1 Tax=Ramazzottius varieornatus TaxID=947166 RepID=A0A1D1UU94_RAMVA|nr:hypothetical protein RvY_05031 [Ramazzottius varieornatus]
MPPTKYEKKRKRSAASTPASQKSQNQNDAPSIQKKKQRKQFSDSPSSPPPMKKKGFNKQVPRSRKPSRARSSYSHQSRVSLLIENRKSKSGRRKNRSPTPESSPEASPVNYLSPGNVYVDENHHLEVRPNDVIDHKFKVVDICGAGTFGRVYKVRDLTDPYSDTFLALKVMQDKDEARQDTVYEREALQGLMAKDPKHIQNVVRFFGHFAYHGHACLLFEHLGPSLHKFLHTTKSNFVPFPMHQLSEITQQTCLALAFLRKCGYSHTDIKTENIVFAEEVTYHDTIYLSDSSQTLVRELSCTNVKLIDFGSAIDDEEDHGTDISTRQYRAPEIMLVLDWNHQIDMWSLGCVLFEVYSGKVLFQAPTVKAQIVAMTRILGPIPKKMLSRVPHDHKYFKNGEFRASDSYRQSPEYMDVMRTAKPLKEYFRNLESTDSKRFLDLLRKFLQYEPKKRITAADALYHEFLSQRISRKRKQM